MREGTTVTFEVTGRSNQRGQIDVGCKRFLLRDFTQALREGGGVALISGTVKGTVDAHGRVVIADERFTESEVREVANNLRIEEPPEPKREWQDGDVIVRKDNGALRVRRSEDPLGLGNGPGWYDETGRWQTADDGVDGFYHVITRGGVLQRDLVPTQPF